MNHKPIIDFSPGSQARKIISEEFKDPGYTKFRKWFFESFHILEKQQFEKEFYEFCEEKNALIPFTSWFISIHVKNYINVIERTYKLDTGKTYIGIYPPQQTFHIEKAGKIHNFAAFSKLIENDTLPITCKHINSMFEHHNYTNLYLNILGEQLQYIDSRVEKIINSLNEIKPGVIRIAPREKEASPSFQPPPIISDFKLRPIQE